MKSVLTLILLAITVAAFSQDYIVKKDGNRIDCKVTKEDSANVYIIMNLGGKDVNAYINRKEIQYIKFGNSSTEIKNNTQNTNTITPITTNTPKHRISFNIGPCFAIGDFGSTNIKNQNAEFTKTGIGGNVYYTQTVNANAGIGLKGYASWNSINTEKIQSSSGYKISATNWLSAGLLTGPIFDFKDASNTHYTLNFLGGPMLMKSPQYNYGSVSVNSATTVALGYDIGFGISFPISADWNLSTNVDYMGADFEFNDIHTSSGSYSEATSSASVKFQVINLTLGLSHNF